ncbi:DUF4212 domain-containing protein [Gracilibacillus boraciitolerans]|nr:DUF4212 domain-containing protein [Gracilibacillus boraciitolerans]
MKQTLNEKQRWYWKKNITLILSLLVVWAIVAFGGAILFAEPLYHVRFLNVTLSYWIAHQGAILVFICLILIYALRMDKLDKKYKEIMNEGKME